MLQYWNEFLIFALAIVWWPTKSFAWSCKYIGSYLDEEKIYDIKYTLTITLLVWGILEYTDKPNQKSSRG